ncbi:hypothetical protein CTAYLR_010625 [Chrysophaeum taylorii]|uniref:Leucine-rich repeat domain-containing protein n=1 Tax=Chrysophaeum taylorii TaxID=2483200 RepID=A0AAD7UEK8_9STRA|nr:hypothetical protein CTAYLR_010625 [Chrysophaeum taylorii]
MKGEFFRRSAAESGTSVAMDPRESALRVFLLNTPEHTLATWAPAREWLAAQQRCDGPEIFDALFKATKPRCENMIAVCAKFFRHRPRDCVVGNRRYVLLEDGDGGYPSGLMFLLVDRRDARLAVPRHTAEHVVLERARAVTHGFSVDDDDSPVYGHDQTLKSVWLPLAETIEPDAFYWCSRLVRANAPRAVAIGGSAFERCCLVSVELNGTTSLGIGAFYRCAHLREIRLPKVEIIESYAFDHCPALVAVSLPAALTIGNYAFRGCAALATVHAPLAASIGDFAFEACVRLRSVLLSETAVVSPNACLPPLGTSSP